MKGDANLSISMLQPVPISRDYSGAEFAINREVLQSGENKAEKSASEDEPYINIH